jgi:hypothetical protein
MKHRATNVQSLSVLKEESVAANKVIKGEDKRDLQCIGVSEVVDNSGKGVPEREEGPGRCLRPSSRQ